MKYDNCMVDIETSGLIAGKHGILQIAAVPFNISADDPIKPKHLFFNQNLKLHPDREWLKSTHDWWMDDSGRVDMLVKIQKTGRMVGDVMNEFNNFCHEHLNEGAKFWSNHTIDWEMINDYIRLADVTHFFFKYNAFRDMRSYIQAFEDSVPGFEYEKVQPSNAHDALSDAIAQAQTVNKNYTTAIQFLGYQA